MDELNCFTLSNLELCVLTWMAFRFGWLAQIQLAGWPQMAGPTQLAPLNQMAAPTWMTSLTQMATLTQEVPPTGRVAPPARRIFAPGTPSKEPAPLTQSGSESVI